MNKLIVSEKHNVAKRIAYILSAGKAKADQNNKIPVYSFKDGNDQVRCLGLKGHILRVDFPTQYSKWQEVDPASLIDARIIKVPVHKSLVKTLQKEAKQADEIIVATDFDREGEVIGVDAANIIKKSNPDIKVKRARFSALTEDEIKKAFSNLDQLYVSLAQAGEARQDIDLIWGATLTRFLSLASSRLGKQFLSVGRVQSPTLALVAEKENERLAFTPQKYWQIKGVFSKDGEQFIAPHKTDKFWKQEEADEIFSKLMTPGKVVEVKQTEQRLEPPAPFNTTAFLTAAAALKISPAQAMRIAENLYNQGFISYPRVDNTVYPPSLNFKEILTTLISSEFKPLAQDLLKEKELKPTRGKKQATDHPPIHPTGVPEKDSIRPREWKIFELVCRRFMATLASAAFQQSVKVNIEVSGEPFLAKGSTLTEEGWYRFYPYTRKKDEEIPLMKKGDEVELIKPIMEAKETQPPPRYSQGRLIKEMEKLHLGTKCLTGDTGVKVENGAGVKNLKLEDLYAQSALKEILFDEDGVVEIGKNGEHRCLSFDGKRVVKSSFFGVSRRLLKNQESVLKIELEDGTSFEATSDHPVLIADGRNFKFIRCAEAGLGDELVSARGLDNDQAMVKTTKIKRVFPVLKRGYVYDILNVNGLSNFVLANDVVVHNSTRHLIIQSLYDRGYVHSDPLIPTETGRKVSEALLKHASRVATPEMTAELEREMDDIANSQTERLSVVDRSREMLAAVMLALKEKKKEVAEEIREGIYGDKIVGKCPNCGKNLRIIRAKKSGKRFVGCEGYPDCTVSYPLPQFGEIIALNETCEPCNSPKVKVISKRSSPWILCLDPKCPTKSDKLKKVDKTKKVDETKSGAKSRVKNSVKR